MKGIRRFFDRIPRPLRFAFDLMLILALLVAWYVSAGCPALGGKTAEFRRAEKAGMVGPSKILCWVPVQSNWPSVGYERLLLADDGDAVLFYACDTERYSVSRGTLYRREKTDRLLLTTLPAVAPRLPKIEYPAVPLFLFADDSAALRAEVDLRYPSGKTETLTAARVVLGEGDRRAETRFFVFKLPVTAANRDTAEALMYCGTRSADLGGQHPAVIRLYDADDRLLLERDYVVQTRNQG